jgi:glycosyltransferase involved in cell wall biosynthesis
MDLKGLNILIDGYNLELQYSTGIKSYGQTLTRALRNLHANTYILSSKASCSDPVLNEVLLFERSNQKPSNLYVLKEIITSSFHKKRAQRIEFSGNVIKNEEMKDFIDEFKGVFSLRECYVIANNLFKLTGTSTRVKIPERIDVWHATTPLPIRINKSKTITTIHDLIPLKLPYTTLDDKKFFYNCTKNAIKNSDLILSVSENTKKDILDFFHVNPDKIFVTYQPIVHQDTLKKDLTFTLKLYGIEQNKYILFLGTIEPKKNIRRLIEAYISLNSEIPLVIAGKKGWLWEDELLPADKFKNKILFLNYLPSEDMSYLYSGALFFIFPSLYEGFGLPPLEAMSFGCPVITSRIASLPEVCGDAALYVDPYSVEDIKNKMQTMLDEPDLRSRLAALGQKRAEAFRMDNYVQRLYNAYKKII